MASEPLLGTSKPPPYNPMPPQPQGYAPPPTQPTNMPAGGGAPAGYQSTGNYPQPSYMGPPPHPQGQALPPQQSTIIIQQPATSVRGGCPSCRVGYLRNDFTLCGICCAFWFFPLGIICCLAMRELRCEHCGAIYG